MREMNNDVEDILDEAYGAVLPYVVFKLKDNKFALSSRYVLHIEVLGTVTPMAGMDQFCRGIILFNDVSVPVFDMRSMFGIGNYVKELESFMQERIKNHEDWVAALEHSVETGEEFKMTTDPHKCAFGKWFDTFESDNSYFNVYMRGVDAPHKAIHRTGEVVMRLMREGKKDEAMDEIRRMKDTDFAKTKEILAGASQIYMEGSREMLIVLQMEDGMKGIIVDSITDIKVLNDMCGVPKNTENCKYISNIAKDKMPDGDVELIQIINTNEL